MTKLGDVRYVYTWAGERVFKVVSFYLFRYRRGRLGEIAPEQRIEVAEARWFPLEEAPRRARLQGRARNGGKSARFHPRQRHMMRALPAALPQCMH